MTVSSDADEPFADVTYVLAISMEVRLQSDCSRRPVPKQIASVSVGIKTRSLCRNRTVKKRNTPLENAKNHEWEVSKNQNRTMCPYFRSEFLSISFLQVNRYHSSLAKCNRFRCRLNENSMASNHG